MKWKMCAGATCACAVWVSVVVAGSAGSMTSKAVGVDRIAAIQDFQQANPRTNFYYTGDQITRVYGAAFGFGDTPEEVADQFRLDYAEMFGVTADELDPRGPLFDERHTQDVMYDWDTESYKFTLVYYTQYESGIPVFRADLRLLVRNEPGHSLVLASSSLRDLGTFAVDRVEPINFDKAKQSALQEVPDLINFSEPRRVIWDGMDDMVVAPAVGIEFVADNGREATADFAKWLFITDAGTGAILYQENLILNVDVVGNVSGMATQGIGADICDPEELEGLQYARAEIQGGNSAFADVDGDFVIPNGGSSEVTVRSPVAGRYFWVNNEGGANTVLSQDVVPPGPADFIHNEANNQEYIRAEVNGYFEANVVRDNALVANPSYPTIWNQENFRVNVNRNASCNATYSGNSINFYRAQGGCSNTANSTIVHHEYGHHLVATGGSGQGQYGEGMSDCQGVIIVDHPWLATGFYNNCNQPLRNADNNMQYPCNGGHACAPLLSGCVWDTRQEMVITEPDNYLDILSSLTVNSILLHSGQQITPQISIDFLTLDDDDNDLSNGTPHYNEICTGFAAHNMDACPEVEFIELRPEELTIIRGVHKSGELADVFTSNNSRMVFQPGITQNPDEPPIWLELTGSSVTDTPTELRFILETRIDTPAVTQTISLFNFNTDMYEEVHTGTTPFNTDGTVDVTVDGDPSRFVNSETLEVKAQLTWKPGPLVILYPWNMGIDQAIWRVVP